MFVTHLRVKTITLQGGQKLMGAASAPTDGTSGTYANAAPTGTILFCSANGVAYQNVGTLASPRWEPFGGGGSGPTLEGLEVINKSGSSIAADKVVAVMGLDATSGKPKIVLADADVAGHVALYVTTAAIANNAEGVVVKSALSAATLNTNSATSAGDPVYLDVTAGAFTHTAPTGADDRVQRVGFVLVKSATVGQIFWDIAQTEVIGTNELQAEAVTQAKIAAASLTGTVAALVAASNVIGGIPVIHYILADQAGGADKDVVLTHKTRVLQVIAINKAAGGAGDGVTIKNGATAITDLIDMNAVDQTTKFATTIDDAAQDIAAGGTLRVTKANGANDQNEDVYVIGMRVA